jgi:hypothetical protein
MKYQYLHSCLPSGLNGRKCEGVHRKRGSMESVRTLGINPTSFVKDSSIMMCHNYRQSGSYSSL